VSSIQVRSSAIEMIRNTEGGYMAMLRNTNTAGHRPAWLGVVHIAGFVSTNSAASGPQSA
jgi:hypothetical protein